MSDIRFNRWLHQSGTGGVFQDSSGRVGIGTSVPTSSLDVQSGTIRIGNNTLSSSGVSTFSTLTATNIIGVSTAGITTAYIGAINDGPLAGFRNRVINGDMRIWQRGTSFSAVTPVLGVPAYTADRWFVSQLISQSATDVTQQTTGATRFAIRVQKRSGSSGASANQLGQVIENLNCLDLPGRQLTLSFTARAGANYSATGNALNISILTCTTADQSASSFINGTAVGLATLQGTNVILTTSNQRFSITTSAVPTNVTNICVLFSENSSASAAGANDWFEVSDVQLEPGPVATPFERRSYGQELALCQRYFQLAGNGCFGAVDGNTSAVIAFAEKFFVPMRVAPTVTWRTGATAHWRYFGGDISNGGSTSLANTISTVNAVWSQQTGFAGMSPNIPIWSRNQTSTGEFMNCNAEL